MQCSYFNSDLIAKYAMTGPRYTSYPTAVEFNDKYSEKERIADLIASNNTNRDLSLYIHIPFCEHVCYYCACNKIITKNHTQSDEYLKYLKKELTLQLKYIDSKKRKLQQLHFGGGTPTFLSKDDYENIWQFLKENFVLVEDGEYSIEIDPRTVNFDYLAHLRKLGFNRISFGIQDFDEQVQKSINRVQSFELVSQLVKQARGLNYRSISMDLIYGLPHQNKNEFQETLQKIIKLSPDRLAVFNYAHLPDLFGAQKQIDADLLPSKEEKLLILEDTIKTLTNNNYEFIGLDHFAHRDDDLVKHQQQGTLYRNFQGYSTYSNCDVVACGISAISQTFDSYCQNHKARDKYYASLDKDELPVSRGINLSQDDIIVRKIITEIMCNLQLDLDKIAADFNIDSAKYFQQEWQNLDELAADGLIKKEGNKISILPPGRLLIRNIAMVFDKYLQAKKHKFSQVI
ncbi:MAG: oxygen-independent coproporphyrinogen III oxidase [Cardiobacteriaceae bacterium]|nr:oxygen-independent coproporphyrinogen III oxidase [Cardiobacteriaceae bacterium]